MDTEENHGHAHDVFPNAEVRQTEPRMLAVGPETAVAVDGTIIVVQQGEGEKPDLYITVHVATDHHGEDVRGMVAQRIAVGLSQ